MPPSVMPDAASYLVSWTGSLSAAGWVLSNVAPLLLAAGACRIVTLLFVPRR